MQPSCFITEHAGGAEPFTQAAGGRDIYRYILQTSHMTTCDATSLMFPRDVSHEQQHTIDPQHHFNNLLTPFNTYTPEWLWIEKC